jgi:hypothetical protein
MAADPGSGPDVDLSAAGLRADGGEVRVSVEALAAKLEQSLPGRTRVQRRGAGLLRRDARHVRSLEVDIGQDCFHLQVDRDRVQCSRERRVGGISIKRESLEPEAWVTALAGELRAEAERSGEAREALAKLLA